MGVEVVGKIEPFLYVRHPLPGKLDLLVVNEVHQSVFAGDGETRRGEDGAESKKE